jgi:hypothetical protein
MACRRPPNFNLASTNLPGLIRPEALCCARFGHPRQQRIERHAVAAPVGIEDLRILRADELLE